MAERFTVEVTYTDRSRTPTGRFVVFSTSVEVLADSDVEAVQVAAQMVDAIREALDGMVLSARITSVIV